MRATPVFGLLASVLAFATLQGFEPGARPTSGSTSNTWRNVTGNLANMASECGNLSLLSAVPRSDDVIAGVALRGLWKSSGSDAPWVRLGGAPETDAIVNRPTWITHDPVHPEVFWESGTYNAGGIYKTSDAGNSFRQLGTIRHIDYVSVDFLDPERRTLLASGHEQTRTIYRSTDGGQVWTNVGARLPTSDQDFSGYPLILSSMTYLVNVPGGSETSGIFRTTDGGLSWKRVSAVGPSGPALVASNGTIYWPASGGLLMSIDSGSTWMLIGRGVRPVHPLELQNEKLVSVGQDHLIISSDRGATWMPFGAPLPFTPDGLVYSPGRRAFLIWHADCRSAVLPDAILEIR